MPGIELLKKRLQNNAQTVIPREAERRRERQSEYYSETSRFAEAGRLLLHSPEYVNRYFYAKQETEVTRLMPVATDIRRCIIRPIDTDYQDGNEKKNDAMMKVLKKAASAAAL